MLSRAPNSHTSKKVSRECCARHGATDVNDSFIVFNATQCIESAELPFSALGCIYRSDLKAAMYGRCVGVDEFDRSLIAMLA